MASCKGHECVAQYWCLPWMMLSLTCRLFITCCRRGGGSTFTPSHPSDTQGWWGGYSAPQYCPSNGHVIALQVQLERPQGAGDDTAMSECGSKLCAANLHRMHDWLHVTITFATHQETLSSVHKSKERKNRRRLPGS